MSREIKKKSVRLRPNQLAVTAYAETEYDKDFLKWTESQASFLKKEEFSKLDVQHLIEEIDSLGSSLKNALENHLVNLFLHLLKIDHQPELKCRSWENSVENARFCINKIIIKNPSLRNYLPEILSDAYYRARLGASSETGLDRNTFSESCPWKLEELLKQSLRSSPKVGKKKRSPKKM